MSGINRIDFWVTLRDPKNFEVLNFGNKLENFIHNYWGHSTSGLGFLPGHKNPKYTIAFVFNSPVERDELEVFLDTLYDFLQQEAACSPKIRLQAYSGTTRRTFLFTIGRN